MNTVVIQLSTQAGFQSGLIRVASWSQWSHVDFVLPGGELLGARLDGGVKIRGPRYAKFKATKRFQILPAIGMINRGSMGVIMPSGSILDFAASQLTKPYDWRGILNFGLHRNWRETDSWFCSELVAWCCEQSGQTLFNRDIDVRRITPRDISISPRLYAVGDNAESDYGPTMLGLGASSWAVCS